MRDEGELTGRWREVWRGSYRLKHLAPHEGGRRVEAGVQVDRRHERLDGVGAPLGPAAQPRRPPVRVRVRRGWRLVVAPHGGLARREGGR